MQREPSLSEIAPVLAVAFILTIILLTGPQSPLALGKPQQGEEKYLTGNASVEIVTAPPSSLKLEQASYTDSQYVLEIPSTFVSVSNVSGRPLLTYKVQMTELGRSELTIAELEPGTNRNITLSHEPVSINKQRVENNTYVAEIFIILRGDKTRILYRDNVTIHVRE